MTRIMADTLMTAAWRGTPIVPSDYDDVAHVVQSVRRARQCVVEFEWRLHSEQLRQLRTAVVSWSGSVVGRYKTFDARVLDAINAALGEPDTRFVLKEPRNGAIDCTVECTLVGDSYRLAGHAPFDVVMGYGLVGTDGATATSHLSDETRAALAVGVDALGWDVVRMREKRLRPARNAMFGFPVAHGMGDLPQSTEPSADVPVAFFGPFSALEGTGAPCLFGKPIEQQNGVYLWTVAVNGVEHVCYVGQTQRGFGTRIGEHVAALLSGRYDIFDADAMSRGISTVRWRPDPDAAARWRSFLGDYSNLSASVLDVLRILRFHIAPIDSDQHLYGRIEGALGRFFRDDAAESAARLFDRRIRVPAAIPGDRPLRFLLSSEATIAGLPDELRT